MSLPTPPRYVVLPEEVIEQAFAPDKPRRALLASFTRILSLAWEAKYDHTPAMNEDELLEFLKLKRRQYYEQMADMELMQWLRSSHPRPGFVQFTFSRSISAKASFDASAENRTEVRKSALLIGGGESLSSLNPDSDSSTPLNNPEASAENRTNGFPTASEILAQTPLLFDGALVISKGLHEREPLDVLAWCAYAYSQKSRLTGPGGVVRNRLLDHEKPPEWTKHRWRESLPEDFLEALDLIQYECDVCQQIFSKRTEIDEHKRVQHPTFAICEICSQKFPDLGALERHVEETHASEEKELVPDESVTVRIDGRMSAEQAWQSVLDQLQMEMPRASFETWVRDTKAIRYGGNALQIGVRNAYARDWLESRVQSTAERLLIDILSHKVTLEFVVSEEVQA